MIDQRKLITRRGPINFPAYIPVTTFGDKYPLDRLVQPYLPRLAPALMVSYHYALQMESTPRLPLFVDSGGFASLFENACVVESGSLGAIEFRTDDKVDLTRPQELLELQECIADVAFPLDFPIPPGMGQEEALRRQRLTIANSHWALANRRRRDLPLYACIQAWDAESARQCARAYVGAPFDGIAIGGLVPRARDLELVLSIVGAVRSEIGALPLHVFGLGKPDMVDILFRAGVDSVDSSSYIQLAADGQLWGSPSQRFHEPSTTDRLHLALCNLATATGRALPLSSARMIFATHALAARTTT